MDDNLNINWIQLLQISYQILIITSIVVYNHFYPLTIQNTKSLIWFLLLVIYIDWLLWKNIYKTTLFALLIIGYLIILKQQLDKHNDIIQQLQEKWQNMDAILITN